MKNKYLLRKTNLILLVVSPRFTIWVIVIQDAINAGLHRFTLASSYIIYLFSTFQILFDLFKVIPFARFANIWGLTKGSRFRWIGYADIDCTDALDTWQRNTCVYERYCALQLPDSPHIWNTLVDFFFRSRTRPGPGKVDFCRKPAVSGSVVLHGAVLSQSSLPFNIIIVIESYVLEDFTVISYMEPASSPSSWPRERLRRFADMELI